MALRLDPAERVVKLVLPKNMSLRKASKFVDKHRQWIDEQLVKLPPLVTLSHGNVIPVLGQDRRINIHYDPAVRRTDITLEPDEIVIHTNKDDPSTRLQRFLKTLAKEEISKLAASKADQIGKDIKSIQCRDTKTRWGSCSPDGKLSFSWRLIFAPYASLDYVVAHEVAHRVHMDHSKNFWKVCESLSANYTEGRGWMAKNSHSLLRYG